MRTAVASPARLGALWFGIQAVWSAVLGVALQSRSEALDPAGGVRTYAAAATLGAIVATLTQLGAGMWSDAVVRRTGHRRLFYFAGTLVAVMALVILFRADTVGTLISAFIALQVGMNLANGPYQAAVPDHVPVEREGLASAWMGALSSAGAVVGLIVAVTTQGPLTGSLLALLLVASFGITLRHAMRLPPIAVPARTPLRLDRDARALLLSRGAIFLGFYTLFGFLFFFMRETLGVGDARSATGTIFLAFTIAAIAGAALAARPTDRIDKRTVVAYAGFTIVAGVVAFAVAPTLPVAFGAAVVTGAAWGAFTTADWAIAFDVLPRTAMATAMAVWNLALTVPQIVAPLLTAPLVTAFDARRAGLGPRAALVLVAIEFFIGTALIARIRPLRGQGANALSARSNAER